MDTTPPDATGHRPRFVAAELRREPGSRVRVRVSLEKEGEEHVAEAAGVGDEAMVLRLVAQTALRAIERATDAHGTLELVGVKRIHAFDETVVLACVRPLGLSVSASRLLGCVPVAGRSLAEATALSVLHATNRILERLTARGPPEE